jgi:hypothetical protein
MGYIYNSQTDDYDYVDEGDSPQSPYEQALASGGPQAAQDLIDAASNYYAGSQDPNAVQVGPNSWVNGGINLEDHPAGSPNWTNPNSYEYLINDPGAVGGTNPTANTPGSGGGRAPFPSRSYNMGWWQGAPGFHGPRFEAPPAFSYDPFTAPTYESAQSDPGYKFAVAEGERALGNSAAAKGIYRTGGTIKNFL